MTGDLTGLPPRRLADRYNLSQRLGGGAFGDVYLSQQYFFGKQARRVAVKISKKTQITESTAAAMFDDAFRLADAMDRLQDSTARVHLVHVFDVGLAPDQDNKAFLVMEYVQGHSLQYEFRNYRSGVPAELLKNWARQICRGLGGLHALKDPVLHRDLKPDNILLGDDGNIRIVDFGLAATMTRGGFVPGTAGTTRYMAPETMDGASTPESDVYSLGVLLYEGLTKRHPFQGLEAPWDMAAADVLPWLAKQRKTLLIEPPHLIDSTIPPGLSATVMKCLRPQPWERYGSASELLAALDRNEAAEPDKFLKGGPLAETGDPESVLLRIETSLRDRATGSQASFDLLIEAAAVCRGIEDFTREAHYRERAWKLNEESVVVRSLVRKKQLAIDVSQAFRDSGQEYKAREYEREAKLITVEQHGA